MVEMQCEDVRGRLHRGEEEDAAMSAHLAGCAACRLEQARTEVLLQALRDSARAEVPAWLDARIRRSLIRRPVRAWLAMGVGAAGLLALYGALAIAFAAGGFDAAAGYAFAGLLAYLTLSSVAVLPLIMRACRLGGEAV